MYAEEASISGVWQAAQLRGDLVENERQLAQLRINLAVLGDQLLLLAGESVFEVIDLAGEISLRVLDLGDVQADDALRRVGLDRQVFAEIYCESVIQRLEEVVELCRVAAEYAVESRGIHRKGSVILKLNAQRLEVNESVISSDGIGDVIQETGLQRAQRAVAGQGRTSVAGAVERELPVDRLDQSVVTGNEIGDSLCDGLGVVGYIELNLNIRRGASQVESYSRNGAGNRVAATADWHSIDAERSISSGNRFVKRQGGGVGADAEVSGGATVLADNRKSAAG